MVLVVVALGLRSVGWVQLAERLALVVEVVAQTWALAAAVVGRVLGPVARVLEQLARASRAAALATHRTQRFRMSSW